VSEEPLKPVILDPIAEMPDKCDTCGEDGPFDPITKLIDAWFGKQTLVIGYECPKCWTSHLYQ
jgi:hypothetical protein